MINMIYILLFLLIILGYRLYSQEKKIKHITKQVNEILFQQKDYYIQHYQEGTLSLLESEIQKLVTRLHEQNSLLIKDKILLKEALENISHQMKTPLTSLNLIQERLKEAEGLEKRKLLREQQQLLNHIQWLVSTLMKMAQLDTNTVIFQKEKTSYQKLYEQFIQPFDIQLDIKNITIHCNYEHQYIDIDLLWMKEALSNILKNCIEHTPTNGHINISMKHNPLYDEIIIQDDGETIDPQDLPHIFERFYKGCNSHDQSVGIGLALSQMIIEKQNGTITVENIDSGVRFIIHIYKENI